MQHRRRVLMVMVMPTEIRITMMQMAQPTVDSRAHQAGQRRTHTDATRHRIVQRPVMVMAVVIVVQVMIRGPILMIGSSSTSATTTRSATVPDQILQTEPAAVGHRVEPGAIPGAASTSSRSASTFHHGLWI